MPLHTLYFPEALPACPPFNTDAPNSSSPTFHPPRMTAPILFPLRPRSFHSPFPAKTFLRHPRRNRPSRPLSTHRQNPVQSLPTPKYRLPYVPFPAQKHCQPLLCRASSPDFPKPADFFQPTLFHPLPVPISSKAVLSQLPPSRQNPPIQSDPHTVPPKAGLKALRHPSGLKFPCAAFRAPESLAPGTFASRRNLSAASAPTGTPLVPRSALAERQIPPPPQKTARPCPPTETNGYKSIHIC